MSKIKTDKWKNFRIVDLFEVVNTHSILKKDIEENSGVYPYVTASEGNNSVVTYVSYDMDKIEKGNSILIGGKTLVISYQPHDYFSNDSHNLALYLKNEDKRTKNIQLFIVTALRASLCYLYSWGDSISSKSIKKDVVKLPSDVNGNPDWSYMEAYIESIESDVNTAIGYLKYANTFKVEGLNVNKWKSFAIYDIFEINSGTKLDKAKMDTSLEIINFVGRSNFNNGITQKVNIIDGMQPFSAGNLTLALGGAYLGSCFIQDEPFYTSQNVVVLIPKFDLSVEVKQFISTAIFKESQNNYQAFIKELNKHIKTDFRFKLPVDEFEEPDYAFMESYIQSINIQAQQVIDSLNFIKRN